MLETMRKHHYVLMLVIAIVVIISFSFWGGYGTPGGAGDWTQTIYGREYRENDLKAAQAALQTAQMSGSPGDPMWRYAQTLMNTQGADRREDYLTAVLVNAVVIREEAKRLGISVEDEDLKKGVQTLPQFQTDGKFDRSKYDAFMSSGGEKESRERSFFAALNDALLLDKMRRLIGGPLPASDYQVNLEYNRRNLKTTAQTFEFLRKEFETLKATDEEAKKYYDTNKEKFDAHKDKERAIEELDTVLRSEPSRDVTYVKLNLANRTEDISKLPKEQQDAKTKEWDETDKKVKVTASQLSNYVTDDHKSIPDAVAALKANPSYLACEAKTIAGLTESNPGEDLKEEPQVVDQIFFRDKGTVQASKGYVIYEVTGKKESALLDFEMAKAKILEKLSKEKVDAALADKANGVRAKLQEALAAGKSFADACAAAGVTPKAITWSAGKPPKDPAPYFSAVQAVAQNLDAGALAAEAVPWAEGTVLVYVEKKELPWDPDKGPKDKEALSKSLALGERNNPYGKYMRPPQPEYSPSPIFATWFQQRREEAVPLFTSAD